MRTSAQHKHSVYDALALAALAAGKVTNRYGDAARAVVEDLTPEQLNSPDLEDTLTAALFAYSDGRLDRIADETVNEAFLAGRILVLIRVEPQLQDWARSNGSEIVWKRSAVLDKETCLPCRRADGSKISGPQANLSAICRGLRQCRCVPFSVAEL